MKVLYKTYDAGDTPALYITISYYPDTNTTQQQIFRWAMQ
jgi:hypothetical protein